MAAYLRSEDARGRSAIFDAKRCGYLVIDTPPWTAVWCAVEEARELSGAIRHRQSPTCLVIAVAVREGGESHSRRERVRCKEPGPRLRSDDLLIVVDVNTALPCMRLVVGTLLIGLATQRPILVPWCNLPKPFTQPPQ